jgi:hypothetical protein
MCDVMAGHKFEQINQLKIFLFILCLCCGSELPVSNQKPADEALSAEEGRTLAPVVKNAANLSAEKGRTLAPDVRSEKMSSYHNWLKERQLLRKNLDNFVVVEDWLAGKADKTDLERRVLQQIVEEKYLKNLQPMVCCTFFKAYLCFIIVMMLMCYADHLELLMFHLTFLQL